MVLGGPHYSFKEEGFIHGLSQEKGWLSLSVSVVRSAVCNAGALWSAALVGYKLSGPGSSVGKACGFSMLLVTRWVNDPEMEYEQGFGPQIKASPSKNRLLLSEDNILITVCLSSMS